jgi:hypothetical protein
MGDCARDSVVHLNDAPHRRRLGAWVEREFREHCAEPSIQHP